MSGGDLDWRKFAMGKFKENRIDLLSLYDFIKEQKAKEILEKQE